MAGPTAVHSERSTFKTTRSKNWLNEFTSGPNMHFGAIKLSAERVRFETVKTLTQMVTLQPALTRHLDGAIDAFASGASVKLTR